MNLDPSARTLFVLTSHTAFGQTGRHTGFWFEELAAPWWVLRDAGLWADIAAVAGQPVADPASIAGDKSMSVDRFLTDPEAAHALATARPIAEVDASRYGAVVLVGGHGSMWDFPTSNALKCVVEATAASGGIVAAVCHGVAGLLNAHHPAGGPLVRGRSVCGFTNAEEAAIGATDGVPFLLETELVRLGANFQGAAPFEAHVVRDGQLLTGQNPQSSQRLGELLVAALRESVVSPV